MVTVDDLKRIYDQIDVQGIVLAKIDSKVTKIEATCGPCMSQVTKNSTAIFGNGGTGISTRVAVLEEKHRVSTNGDPNTWTIAVPASLKTWGAIGAIIAALIGSFYGGSATTSSKTPEHWQNAVETNVTENQ